MAARPSCSPSRPCAESSREEWAPGLPRTRSRRRAACPPTLEHSQRGGGNYSGQCRANVNSVKRAAFGGQPHIDTHPLARCPLKVSTKDPLISAPPARWSVGRLEEAAAAAAVRFAHDGEHSGLDVSPNLLRVHHDAVGLPSRAALGGDGQPALSPHLGQLALRCCVPPQQRELGGWPSP